MQRVRSVGVARFFFYAEDWAELAVDVGDRHSGDTAPEETAATEPADDRADFDQDWWLAVTAMREKGVNVASGEDVVGERGRVTGQTVATASREQLEVKIIDDASLEADATVAAVTAMGAAFIRTRPDRAADDVQRWFDERAG